MKRWICMMAGVLAFWAPQADAAQVGSKDYPRGRALISVSELKGLIDAQDPHLVVIAAQNSAEYLLGHIPGAYQLDRPVYEAPAETQDGVTGNLIDSAGFTRLAQKFGVDAQSKVVIYDSKYDATRLWWAFVYYGKADIRVLDGGIKAWKGAGYSIDLLAPALPEHPGNFVARIALPQLRVDTAQIAIARNDPGAQLWDNRDRKEFTGEELKKGAYRAGRIPGSAYSDWSFFKSKDNSAEWLPAGELQVVIDRLGYDLHKEQYFYCQSGVRSTQALFALYLLGWPLERLHNYDSSWIGWSKDASLPLLTGNETTIRTAATEKIDAK